MDLKIYFIMLNNMINNISNLTREMYKPIPIPVYLPVYNSIKNFFVVITTIGTGLVIATVFVGLIMGNVYGHDYLSNNIIEDDLDSNEEDEEDEEYENKYLDEYKNLENNDLGEDYKDSFIEEKTPRGIVKMNYNPCLNCFNYYSNSKEIPYSYLEVVGRSFVIKNNCKNIFIDYQKEIDKANKLYEEQLLEKKKLEEKRLEEERERLQKEEEQKNSVFAIFKSYNTSKVDSEITAASGKKIVDENNKVILPENSNRYIYKGKLIEYSEYINKGNLEKNPDEFEHLDYATFKKLSKELGEKKTS